MTTQDAQTLADMSNAAEAAILTILNRENPEMLNWYMDLPREKRIEIAMNAAKETVAALK